MVCFCSRALCQSLLTVSFFLVAGFFLPHCPPMRTVLNIDPMGCHRLHSDSEGLTSRGWVSTCLLDPAFGSPPKRLLCTRGLSGSRPTTLPVCVSVWRKSDTGWGLDMAKIMFPVARLPVYFLSNPILNPSFIPDNRYWTNCLSGWSANSVSHWPASSGVVMRSAWGGKISGAVSV